LRLCDRQAAFKLIRYLKAGQGLFCRREVVLREQHPDIFPSRKRLIPPCDLTEGPEQQLFQRRLYGEAIGGTGYLYALRRKGEVSLFLHDAFELVGRAVGPGAALRHEDAKVRIELR
jgi:hypothetical protein